MLRTAIHRCCLILAGLLATLALLEAGIRLTLPRFDPMRHVVFQFDATTGAVTGPSDVTRRQWKNTGDFDVQVRFNQHGLRDDLDIAKATKSDWIALGDSFTFGWGVAQEQRFSSVLARTSDLQVFNLAAPGDIDHYAKLIEYARVRGAADARLIVAVCMENDVLDYSARGDIGLGNTAVAAQASPLVRTKRFLSSHLAIFSAVSFAVHHNMVLREMALKAGLLLAGNLPTVAVPSTRSIASTVGRIVGLIGERKAVVLLVPSRSLWNSAETARHRAAHLELRQLLIDADVSVVDPLEQFESDDEPLANYFRNDGHWNERGHAIAAQLLVTKIVGDRR